MHMRTPPFCPNNACEAHYPYREHRWWVCDGSYASSLHPRIQRFRCKLCGRRFGAQTFHIDYYAKRRVDYRKLAALVGSCCGVRQTARVLGVGYETVANRTMRFARQALAMQSLIIDGLPLKENLCADGLESYWVSKYVPNNLTVLAGSASRFIYGAVGSSLRRSGRMSERQLARREILEQHFRADPRAESRSFREICDMACRLVDNAGRQFTVLDTDEHLGYRRVLSAHAPWHHLHVTGRAQHRSTSSLLPRTAVNPLAPINTIDRQIRIDLAEHVRRTVRFARNPNRSMERFWVWCFTYNYRKRFRINQPSSDSTAHWEVAGIDPQRVREAERGIWQRRRYLSHARPVGSMLVVWMRMIERPFRDGPDYLPRFLTG